MKLLLVVVFISMFVCCALSGAGIVHAKKTIEDAESMLGQAVAPTGVQIEQSLPEFFGYWVKIALSVVGIGFFGLMLYAGFAWMTAQGVEETIAKAKKTVIMASIGLGIIVASYAITGLVITRLLTGPPSVEKPVLPQEKPPVPGPTGCCVDWVAATDAAALIGGTSACRITTQIDCKEQGEKAGAGDILYCSEGEGCWLFFAGYGENDADKCAKDHC